jgi:hypothetical protein
MSEAGAAFGILKGLGQRTAFALGHSLTDAIEKLGPENIPVETDRGVGRNGLDRFPTNATTSGVSFLI